MTPEGRVKAKVNAMLKAFGTHCWRFMPVQSGYGTPALDYLTCVQGRFIAIETKVKGKTLTPRQQATKRDIEAAGGVVLVVDDDESLAIAMQIIIFEAKVNGVQPWTTEQITPPLLGSSASSKGKPATRAASPASKNV